MPLRAVAVRLVLWLRAEDLEVLHFLPVVSRFFMKYRLTSSPRAATFALVAALGAFAPLLTPQLQAAPKPQLQIWPDRRVLLVLPIQISPTWNADAQLGQAILPLAQPQLQQAFAATGKFSVTLPYRFDPVLRRGLTEKQLAENDIKTMLSAPTLVNSRPVIDKLNFEQPIMTTEVFLEELTIGGDSKKPTVQLQVSGKLYEQGNPNPIRSETFRSRAMVGKTPSDRLNAAAKDAFSGLAAIFVEPPAAFDLPAPIEAAPRAQSGSKNTAPLAGIPAGGTPMAESSASGSPATNGGNSPAPMAPAPLPSTATPNTLPATPGAPLVPQLPASEPPLGVTAGENTAAG